MSEPDAAHALQQLLELARTARDDSLGAVYDAVASAIMDLTGFRAVCVNLYRPAWDDYEAVLVRATVHFEDIDELLGTCLSAEQIDAVLSATPPILPAAWLLTEDSQEWMALPAVQPSGPPAPAGPEHWQPTDGVILTFTDSSGEPLGLLSIDVPDSGLRPTYEEMALLRTISAHCEQALMTARYHRTVQASEAMSAHMLEASQALSTVDSFDAAREIIFDAIVALGFERVAIFSTGGRPELILAAQHRGGGNLRTPTLDGAHLGAFVEEHLESDGLCLIPAAALFGGDGERSARNGRGPRAWNDHALLLPIWDDARRLVAIVVVEDPVDRLLPTPTQRNLLRLLGDHAGSTYTNLRMVALQRQFLSLVLGREGAQAMTEALKEILGAPVALVDWQGEPLAVAGPGGAPVSIPPLEQLRAAGDSWQESPDLGAHLIVPLRPGGSVEGYLVVEPDELSGPLLTRALAQAVPSFSLHALLLAQAQEAEYRTRGSLIDELMDDAHPDLRALSRRISRLGHDPDSLAFALCVAPAAAPWEGFSRSAAAFLTRAIQSTLATADATGIIGPRGDTIVVLATSPPSASLRELAESVVQATKQATGLVVVVGVSRPVDGVGGLGEALGEASQAARVARSVPGLSAVAVAGELDLRHLLLSGASPQEALAAARRVLAPLVGHDGEGQLLDTLGAYLEAVGNLQATADRLGIHVNSLRHRVGRIERLLSVDLRDARSRVDLDLALELTLADRG